MRRQNIRVELGNAMAKARKQAGITQQALAHRCRTRQANISRLENGHENVSVEFLSRVSQALGRKLHIQLL